MPHISARPSPDLVVSALAAADGSTRGSSLDQSLCARQHRVAHICSLLASEDLHPMDEVRTVCVLGLLMLFNVL